MSNGGICSDLGLSELQERECLVCAGLILIDQISTIDTSYVAGELVDYLSRADMARLSTACRVTSACCANRGAGLRLPSATPPLYRCTAEHAGHEGFDEGQRRRLHGALVAGPW